MSMMGELKFFLGLQVHQSPRGIFISQLQYAIELLKKHGMDDCVSMSTPMSTKKLDADLQGTPTDQMNYRRMIRGLMYLIASRPDIAFATFVCARYQARPTVKYLKEVKRIFWYLRQSYNIGLSYPKDFRFELILKLNMYHYLRVVHKSSGCEHNYWTMDTSTTKYRWNGGIILVRTEYQLADLFTKALPKEHFEYLVHRIEIIMAQLQGQADVHQDELCPLNKRYALMDANKKIDLDNLLCPNESKIIANILQNHPLRFSIAASSLVPWIYLEQLWHTLKEDGSKYRLKFVLDIKYIILTLNHFRRIFQLPQATNNNHERFVTAPKFSEMVSFFLKDLGFTLELRSPSNFKTIGLVQTCQTLGKMFARCLTTRATSHDQPPLQIMQMLYCFVNNVHVDYAELLREGLHYLLEHPSTLIPYLRFTKLIVAYYMTAYPEISKRVHDKYHNFENDNSVKRIFNLGNNKAGVGMKIPSWMITDKMKLTKHYQMTPSAPRTSNPNVNEGESSAQQSSTIIKLRIPPRRSTHNTPPTPISTTPISTAAEVEDMTLRDTIQLSIDEQKSHDDLEA
ncbi:hypothetical protein Tco_0778560 [Tanacetum coccineum]